jgi:phosphohistidine phosphatase
MWLGRIANRGRLPEKRGSGIDAATAKASNARQVKTLLVLRHAKSSWKNPALDDHQRPLNQRGRRDGPRMGKLLRRHGLIPDAVISSDAVRARLTAKAVGEAAGYAGEILLDPRLYMAGAADIRSLLRTVREKTETVLIVGHNPGLEDLVAQLTGDRQDLPTAAIAHVVLPIDRWGDLRRSTRGTLSGYWLPKELT